MEWNEVRIDTDPAEREKMVALARRTSVPQIFVGDTHVGRYEDLMALHRAGKFQPLPSGEPGSGGGRGPAGPRRPRHHTRQFFALVPRHPPPRRPSARDPPTHPH